MNTIKNTTQKFAKGLFNPDNKLSLIPNWLSFSRVIGGLAIPIMTYTGTPLPVLFGTISFLAISDFLDGKAARIIAKEETEEGAMLDAVSDKIFSLLLIIGIIPMLPVFAINGILESAIALINAKLLSKGGHPKSNLLGKAKIWPLSIALILGYLALAIQNLNIAGITNETLLAISTALSIGTIPLQSINIKQYLDEYKKQTKNKEEENIEKEPSKQNTSKKNKALTNKKTKTSKLKLSKENHMAMIYELNQDEKDKQIEETKETGKQYTKRNKH